MIRVRPKDGYQPQNLPVKSNEYWENEIWSSGTGGTGLPISTLGGFICIFLRNILPLLKTFFKTKTHSWNCCNRGEQQTMCSLFLETQAIQFWSLLQCSIVPKCFVLSVGIEVRICEYPTDLNPGPTDWEIPVFLVPKTAVDPYSPYEQLVAH